MPPLSFAAAVMGFKIRPAHQSTGWAYLSSLDVEGEQQTLRRPESLLVLSALNSMYMPYGN